MHLNFLGLFNFTAPYLPWVLLAFSVTLRSNAVVDLLGIIAGAPAATQECSSHSILKYTDPSISFLPPRPICDLRLCLDGQPGAYEDINLSMFTQVTAATAWRTCTWYMSLLSMAFQS